jgi:hypothetical protein
MKNQIFTFLTTFAVIAVAFFAGRGCRNANFETTSRTDTVVVRDTIRDTVPVPVERRIVRVDTVWLRAVEIGAAADSVAGAVANLSPDSIAVELQVERKVYRTADYRAVVEGFRPELVEMEVFRTTVHVNSETVLRQKPKRWGVGIHAGYGISTRGAAPYIGVGVQYNILAW